MPIYPWRDSGGKGRGSLLLLCHPFLKNARCPVSFPTNGASRKVPAHPGTFLLCVFVSVTDGRRKNIVRGSYLPPV